MSGWQTVGARMEGFNSRNWSALVSLLHWDYHNLKNLDHRPLSLPVSSDTATEYQWSLIGS